MKDYKANKVIVADDNQNSLMFIGLLLKRLGYNVIPARNGLEVLKLLKFIEPDVVMLDIAMGTVDGIAVLEHLKKDRQTSDIPVIMVSGDSSTEIITQCKKLGCTDYITKPVSVEKLHTALGWCNLLADWTKRKHLRISLEKKVIVIHKGIPYNLYTETLSEGGAFIRKKDPFPKGSNVQITLPLNDERAVQLQAEVVHVKELFGHVFPPGMGIKFTEITDHESAILKNYLEQIIAGDILDEVE
jgi:CheY-like chemotaxis protein